MNDLVVYLETNRLFMRRYNINDSYYLYYNIFNSYDNYKFYDPFFITNYNVLVDYLIRQEEYNNYINNFRWVIVKKDSLEVIGIIHLHLRDFIHNKIKIGYIIAPIHQNKGYAKEAINEVISFATNILKINRIEANIVEGNEPSIRALLNNGFTYEFTKFNSYRINNEYYNELGYVIINKIE